MQVDHFLHLVVVSSAFTDDDGRVEQEDVPEGRRRRERSLSFITKGKSRFRKADKETADLSADVSPVLFGSFVHRGHPYLPVPFGPSVVNERLILERSR